MRFLMSSRFGREWFASGDMYATNLTFDDDVYPEDARDEALAVRAALVADTVRFDASDLMPPPLGNELFWDAMIRYVDGGPTSLDAILAELEAAWPDTS
jgi:alpha-glucoside transport system substrate-binding protein